MKSREFEWILYLSIENTRSFYLEQIVSWKLEMKGNLQMAPYYCVPRTQLKLKICFDKKENLWLETSDVKDEH